MSGNAKNDVAVLACYEKEHGVATSRRVLACYEKAWLGVGGVLACYEKERGDACPEVCSHVTKKLEDHLQAPSRCLNHLQLKMR